jgi:hypothetical protein
VNIHHNSITLNGGQADRAVGGGVSICTGTDNYTIDRNYICGNFNLGDGAGIGHYGLSNNGVITNNLILFNQNFNQGQGANGGGLLIAGELPAAATLTRGTGNVMVDGNLIQGNHAGSGQGGGVRTQLVNGEDVARSPNQPNNWWAVRMTNNMIVNNVAGWSGAGISLQDTANATIVLNTIANNDSTGTVGAIVGLGPQPAGISSERHSLGLDAVIPGNASSRRNFSNPTLTHNIIWHNRAFTYDDTGTTARLLPALSVTSVGECAAGANYADLGVLDPAFNLSPQFSILTSGSGNNISADPEFLNEYCNTARDLTANPMQVAIEPAEGGNAIEVRYGPLSREWPLDSGTLWDYHIADTSPAINRAGPQPSGDNVDHDFDRQVRPQGAWADWGADEVGGAGPPAVRLYFSTAGNFAVPGVGAPFDDADIYSWDGTNFARVFDGSAAGLPGNADIDALLVVDADTFYMSFLANATLPGIGTVADEDIVLYDAGSWSLYFDGSDVGLTTTAEDIDAFEILGDGSAVISTSGNGIVPGVGAFNDEDLLRCAGSFGPATSCTWSVYFDGSDVALTAGSENVDGVSVSGSIYLSTTGNFGVTGLAGQNVDVFACNGPTTGPNTACSNFSLYFDGSVDGVTDNLDAIDLP